MSKFVFSIFALSLLSFASPAAHADIYPTQTTAELAAKTHTHPRPYIKLDHHNGKIQYLYCDKGRDKDPCDKIGKAYTEAWFFLQHEHCRRISGLAGCNDLVKAALTEDYLYGKFTERHKGKAPKKTNKESFLLLDSQPVLDRDPDAAIRQLSEALKSAMEFYDPSPEASAPTESKKVAPKKQAQATRVPEPKAQIITKFPIQLTGDSRHDPSGISACLGIENDGRVKGLASVPLAFMEKKFKEMVANHPELFGTVDTKTPFLKNENGRLRVFNLRMKQPVIMSAIDTGFTIDAQPTFLLEPFFHGDEIGFKMVDYNLKATAKNSKGKTVEVPEFIAGMMHAHVDSQGRVTRADDILEKKMSEAFEIVQKQVTQSLEGISGSTKGSSLEQGIRTHFDGKKRITSIKMDPKALGNMGPGFHISQFSLSDRDLVVGIGSQDTAKTITAKTYSTVITEKGLTENLAQAANASGLKMTVFSNSVKIGLSDGNKPGSRTIRFKGELDGRAIEASVIIGATHRNEISIIPVSLGTDGFKGFAARYTGKGQQMARDQLFEAIQKAIAGIGPVKQVNRTDESLTLRMNPYLLANAKVKTELTSFKANPTAHPHAIEADYRFDLSKLPPASQCVQAVVPVGIVKGQRPKLASHRNGSSQGSQALE